MADKRGAQWLNGRHYAEWNTATISKASRVEREEGLHLIWSRPNRD